MHNMQQEPHHLLRVFYERCLTPSTLFGLFSVHWIGSTYCNYNIRVHQEKPRLFLGSISDHLSEPRGHWTLTSISAISKAQGYFPCHHPPALEFTVIHVQQWNNLMCVNPAKLISDKRRSSTPSRWVWTPWASDIITSAGIPAANKLRKSWGHVWKKNMRARCTSLSICLIFVMHIGASTSNEIPEHSVNWTISNGIWWH